MLSPAQIEAYRRMTPRERLRETIELCRLADAALDALPPEERARRLRLLEEEHQRSNDALLRTLARAR